MAEEASQSWQKVKGTSHMEADKRVHAGKLLFFKTIKSGETYSLSQKQHGKDLPPKFNYILPGPSHDTWELWELQVYIWVGTHPNHIKNYTSKKDF